MKIPFTIFVLAGLWLSAAALAQTRATSISFQGALTGSDGKALADGAYNLTFQFWNDATSSGDANKVGSAIVANGVTVKGGIVSTALPVDPSTFDGSTRYLGIRVNGGTELQPRVLVTSVPYAHRSQSAGDTNGDLQVSGGLSVGNGVRVSGAQGGEVSFVGDFAEGQLNNWIGSGGSANFYRLLGAAGDRHAGYGAAVGPNIVSPIIWFYAFEDRNCFQVRAVDYLQQIQDGTPLFTVRRRAGGPLVGIGTEQPDAQLDVRGTTRTQVLQITGGSDLAEGFEITPQSGRGLIEPGMVMVIDREHDGRLLPCADSYDSAVAGVISGANGLAPGMVMKSEAQPMATGEHPLAMTGRVYCWVDATEQSGNGPVHRGDRLTTSRSIGHAMKATDDAKAPGAVIGKALTELKDGKGLVLVLVNLQ